MEIRNVKKSIAAAGLGAVAALSSVSPAFAASATLGTPDLASTGVNAAPLEWLGGGLIVAGLIFVGIRIVGFGLSRRRRARKEH
jgi:hypothetical protein